MRLRQRGALGLAVVALLHTGSVAAAQGVGYTTHHEGVCHLTQKRGCSSHKIRGPPASSR